MKTPNRKELNKTFWNKYASDFDAIYGTKNSLLNNAVNKFFRKSMKVRFDKTLQNIPENNVSVIDIGCGPGHYCFSLAKKGNNEILGIDFSENMIQISNSHAKELTIGNKINFQVENFQQFEPHRKYDYTIMMGFLEYFKNAEEILQKAISITDKKVLVSLPVNEGLLAFQRKLRYKNRCFLKLYSYKEIEELIKKINISKYTIERIGRDFFVTIIPY